MHGGHLIEKRWIDKLQARREQLCANDQCHQTAREEHGETKDEVHRANVFVIGRVNPTTPALNRAVVTMVNVKVVVVGNYRAHRTSPSAATFGLPFCLSSHSL